jgi:predicted transcriptional regulator of viral defense system
VHGDPAAARVAGRQQGVASYAELRDAGLGRGAIAHRVTRDRLHRVHRGVFLVGHAVPPEFAEHFAAVGACGPQAYISHESALETYGVLEPTGGEIHVTVIGGRRRSRKGIRVHRTTRIAPYDLGQLDNGLRITSAARAILDFADTATRVELSRAINEAHVQDLATPQDLREILQRTPGRKGAALLTATLDRHDGPTKIHPGLEQTAYALFKRTPIPIPQTNAKVHGTEVDLYWPEEGLVVELDSGRFHGTPAAVDRDRRKEAHLRRHDLEVLRYSWWQVTDESHFLVAEVAAKLEERRRQARP